MLGPARVLTPDVNRSGLERHSKSRFARAFAAFCFTCALTLTGCVVGPNYSRPSAPTPTAWKEQPPEGWKTATPHDEISKGDWWRIFGDAELNALETQAIAANQNLQAAAQRVIAARAQALATRSNLFPTVSGGFSPERTRISGTRPVNPGASEAAYTANTFTLPVQASYEVDLWGQIRRSVESANALTQRSVAEYENVLLQLKSDVASFYIMARYIDQELVILRNNIDLQQRALDLANVRHNGGVASGLDVSAAETLLNTTQATYVGLGVQRAQFEHALAVLLGKPPAEFSLPVKPLQIAPPALPSGLPSDLLERRPDVASAERLLASDNAQIGVARAAFFPNVTLAFSAGGLSSFLSQILSAPSLVWSASAQATQPIYTGGRLSANLMLARANYDESVANYRQTVLSAFQEVEDGLSTLRVLEQQATAYDQAIRSAQETVDISTARYREGLANYLEVITAEEQLLTNQRVADQVLEQRLLTTIELIQALGGGWQDSVIYRPGAPLPGQASSSSLH
jgi:NodT family efflux transporter outer membrane factor (OMF) lipoprotein